MNMPAMLKLGSTLSSLKMSDDPQAFAPLFEMLGVDEHTGVNFLEMLRVQAEYPDQLMSEFMKEGGLMRALASPREKVERRHNFLKCPHCSELIVL